MNKKYIYHRCNYGEKCDICRQYKTDVGFVISRFPKYKEERICEECFEKKIMPKWEEWENFINGEVTHA